MDLNESRFLNRGAHGVQSVDRATRSFRTAKGDFPPCCCHAALRGSFVIGLDMRICAIHTPGSKIPIAAALILKWKLRDKS